MTRLVLGLGVVLLSASSTACGGTAAVQCDQSSSCDLAAGGVCAIGGAGNHWCSYPDASCPSGYRYSNFQVGDGLSGVCVPQAADAGIDAPNTGLLPSCLALPSTCGAMSNDSCCNSLTVPGGSYFRSYDLAGDSISKLYGNMNAPATVSDFRLDKYEITVGRFRAFVAGHNGTQANPPTVGTGTHPKIAGSGWEASWASNLLPDTQSLVAALKCEPTTKTFTWTDTPGANENRPINCITWYEAMAFCAWDGGYLPSEAEWNYAATGGDQQRAYSWSSPASSVAIDNSHASYNDGTTCSGDGQTGCAVTDLLPVGTKPLGDSRWGQSDMAGNVWEWTLDAFLNNGGSYTQVPCTDCAYLTPSNPDYRTNRGGSFGDTSQSLRTGWRGSSVASGRFANTGARCARSVP